MKDIWYADHRDLVKWGVLANLAAREQMTTIVQVAFLRKGKRYPLVTGNEEFSISPEVWEFFRNVSSIQDLGERLSCRVLVIDAAFDPRKRSEYRELVVGKLSEISGSRIVLLDPDIGIEPTKASGAHVTKEDIEAVWRALREGDWLVLYQHASRNKRWKELAKRKFADICGVSSESFTAPKIAADVAFFAARRLSWQSESLDVMRAMPHPPPAALIKFLKPYDREIQKLALQLRWLVLEEMAPCYENIYDAYSAVAIGYGASDRLRDGIFHIAVYSKHVNLGFNDGAALADPKGILLGSGNRIRHLAIKTPEDLARPEIRAYIQRARKFAMAEARKLGEPPPPKPKGVVSTVKAIYPKKRRPK